MIYYNKKEREHTLVYKSLDNKDYAWVVSITGDTEYKWDVAEIHVMQVYKKNISRLITSSKELKSCSTFPKIIVCNLDLIANYLHTTKNKAVDEFITELYKIGKRDY